MMEMNKMKSKMIVISLFAMFLALTSGVASASVIVADYRDDYAGPTPATGWSYQYHGSVGNESQYTDMDWNGSRWQDGSSPTPNLHSTGGHPGVPSGSAAFAIAGYTVDAADPQNTTYTLKDGQATYGVRSTNGASDGLEIRVYVNDTQIVSTSISGGADYQFNDLDLGDLVTGDTIYVAVGPGATSANDAFALDYYIEAVPEPASLILLGLGTVLLLGRRR